MLAAPRYGPVLALIIASLIIQSGYAIEHGLSTLPFGGAASPQATSNTYTTKEGVEFIRAPMPKYPPGTNHLKGRAIVRLKLNQQTGQVLSVALLQSTGQTILDRAALEALKQWRTRPGVKSDSVDIPIVFLGRTRTHGAPHSGDY